MERSRSVQCLKVLSVSGLHLLSSMRRNCSCSDIVHSNLTLMSLLGISDQDIYVHLPILGTQRMNQRYRVVITFTVTHRTTFYAAESLPQRMGIGGRRIVTGGARRARWQDFA